MAREAGGIVVKSLTKTYKVHEREAGLLASLRSVVRRRYRTVVAVDDLSFTVEPGERVGFLGPNGAGKTTTLKVLAGLLYPTSGEVRVSGFSPERREPDLLKRITLVMGQKQQLLWDLPPVETFALNRALYDIPEPAFRRALDELYELLDLGPIASKPTRQLSLGERMKCELAAALLHGPEVLFLDEPTIGLDVSMQLQVREFVRRYSERSGATILLTSHDMDDVVALCPRIVVIDKGRLRYDGDLAALVRAVRPEKRVLVRFGPAPLGPGPGAAPLEAAKMGTTATTATARTARAPDREALERAGTVIEHDATHAVLQVPHERLREVVSFLLGEAWVADLTIEDPPLEEVLRDVFAEGASAEVRA